MRFYTSVRIKECQIYSDHKRFCCVASVFKLIPENAFTTKRVFELMPLELKFFCAYL